MIPKFVWWIKDKTVFLCFLKRTACDFAVGNAVPPHQVLPMPSLSPTMTEGTISSWKVSEGDEVKQGDTLAEVNTDKASMEMEAMEEGFVARILVQAGEESIPVGQPVAIIAENQEDVSAFKDYQPPSTSSSSASAQQEGLQKEEEEQQQKQNETALQQAASVAEEPARTVQERPDYRPINEIVQEGKPTRSSRAPTDPDIGKRVTPVAQTPPEGSTVLTVRDALNKCMDEELSRDPSVFALGEEIGEFQGAYKVTKGLLQKHGSERVMDTPITEAGFTGLGIGAAFYGLKPIVEFMTFNFAMQSMDQLINSAAKTLYMSASNVSCPIVFRGPNGPAAGVAAQHSQDFSPWYSSVPGLKVVSPYDAEDARGLLRAAIRDPDPVMVLENELLYGQEFAVADHVLDPDFQVPIGEAIIMREGKDITLVSYSKQVGNCMKAAEELASKYSISAEVLNLRTIRPLDANAIAESVRKTNRVVCVEECWPQCGIAAEVAALVMERCFDHLDAPMERLTAADVPLPYAQNLERACVPQADDVTRVARRVCHRQI